MVKPKKQSQKQPGRKQSTEEASKTAPPGTTSGAPESRPPVVRTLRISGLVRARNLAQQKLSAGLPPAEVEPFRRWVQETLSQLDEILRRYQVSLDSLPAISRGAYRYLKSIDLERLPVRTPAPPAAAIDLPPLPDQPSEPSLAPVRIKNLISICNDLQLELTKWAQAAPETKPTATAQPTRAALLEHIQKLSARVEQICQEANALPGDLPDPSKRAYQWIKSLSQAETLELHLQALRQVQRFLSEAALRQKLPVAQRGLAVHFEFYHIPGLYRTKRYPTEHRITASQIFTDAPAEVLSSLAYVTLLGKSRRGAVKHWHTVETWAASEEASEALVELDSLSEPSSPTSQGQYYDLEPLFEKVNTRYFEGRLPQPRLRWSRSLTHSKFGHYHFAADSLMISRSLDHHQVPSYVVEFVLYHELLHKALGVQRLNGRRYTHTQEFRQAEEQFEQYAAAQQYLQRLSQHIRRIT